MLVAHNESLPIFCTTSATVEGWRLRSSDSCIEGKSE
jgi:hypothetical protein